jgi:hypothetical protein
MKVKEEIDLKTNGAQPVVVPAGNDSQNNAPAAEPYPKRRSDLNYRTIDGEAVILNRKDGRLHQLNPTASFIWDCCDGNSNIAAIIDRLADAYEVDYATASKDVEQAISQLQRANLLEDN